MQGHTALANAREARGLRLAHAARDLSIPEATLAAFERGDIADLPPECFATGFLRTYCRYLGISEEAHIQSLRDAYRSASSHKQSLRERFLNSLWKKFPALRIPLPPEIVSWGIITVFFLSAWVGYTLLIRPQSDAADTQASAATLELKLPESVTRD